MKLFTLRKDGGPLSRVWGFFFIEWKRLFSVVLMHFADGSREAYHNHAFNAVSWVLKGKLIEHRMVDDLYVGSCIYRPSFRPIITTRDNMHRVSSEGDTLVFSLRGPWVERWQEYLPATGEYITLTHGRKVVSGL